MAKKRAHAVVHRPRKRQNMSRAQLQRAEHEPSVPRVFEGAPQWTDVGRARPRAAADEARIADAFPQTHGRSVLELRAGGEPAAAAAAADPGQPLRVGFCFCARQAPGGHNAVWGLKQALRPGDVLLGFEGGTEGLFDQRALEITDEVLELYRNQGGYDLLGRSVDRISTEEEQAAAQAACAALRLDALVLVGGSRTATYAAVLAERFAAQGVATAVVVIPAEIDGTLMSGGLVEAPLGFDTSTKVSAQLVANLATDAASSKKYSNFVKLMGRAPSHVALEVALQTQPNMVLLSEEVEARRMTLPQLVTKVADLVASRAAAGKNFSVIVVAEGLIAALSDVGALIEEINGVFAAGGGGASASASVDEALTPWSRALLDYLPPVIRAQMLLERESGGSVQLSAIETDRLLAILVGDELERRKAAGTYAGSYNYLTSFFGYQARSGVPSAFDCALGVALGRTAAALARARTGGYMATVAGLNKPAPEWTPVGVPLTALLDASSPTSPPKVPVAKVSLHGPAYRAYAAAAPSWEHGDLFINPGPVQFAGAAADTRPRTVQCNGDASYLDRIRHLQKSLDVVRQACAPGCSTEALQAATGSVDNLVDVLSLLP